MGRGFSQAERERIDAQLRRRGRELFAREGVKGASVEAIVEGAGISKGSFYAFFESKEELFLQLLAEIEEESRDSLLRTMEERRFPSAEERIYFFLREQYRVAGSHPFLRRNLRPEVVSHIAQRVGEERFREHRALDDRFLLDVAGRWVEEGVLATDDLERVIELWKAPYWVYLHAEESPEGGERTLDDLLHAIAAYQGRRAE